MLSNLHGTLAIVVALFRVVLNRPRLEPDDNLLDLGIQSCEAAELIWRINRTFDRHLSSATILEHPTALAMAEWLDAPANSPPKDPGAAVQPKE